MNHILHYKVHYNALIYLYNALYIKATSVTKMLWQETETFWTYLREINKIAIAQKL